MVGDFASVVLLLETLFPSTNANFKLACETYCVDERETRQVHKKHRGMTLREFQEIKKDSVAFGTAALSLHQPLAEQAAEANEIVIPQPTPVQ